MTETLECRRCGKPTQYNFCSKECSKANNDDMAKGYDAQGNQTYASPEAMRETSNKIMAKVGEKRYARIIRSIPARIQYVKHAYDYVSHLAPNGSSAELDALVSASQDLEIAFSHMVWGE